VLSKRTTGALSKVILLPFRKFSIDVMTIPFNCGRDLLLGAGREDAAQQTEEKDESRNKLDGNDRRQKSEEGNRKKARPGLFCSCGRVSRCRSCR
jgi:hypothetical protein